MTLHTEREPRPKLDAKGEPRRKFQGIGHHTLPPPDCMSDVRFEEVIKARQSKISGPVADQQLGTLLWHITLPRRGGQGRFGQPWEGRVTPSAGGLHVISILCIPIDYQTEVGVYDHSSHSLQLVEQPDQLRRVNAKNVGILCAAQRGTTLQFIADANYLSSYYENSETLLWRDSGALAATICLVATAMGLTSVILGRTGADLLTDWEGFVGVGAVHIGAPAY